ncbi:MAG: AAA family ATPase [Brevundimonas sp.]|nr:AAA family ATPase [Brevundimonas sp.]
MTANPRIVITGGPGSGKTTLIEALARRGFETEPEAGRAVIRAQQAAGGNALPWADRSAFAEAMLAHDLAAFERRSDEDEPVFFDRGIPDIIGYLDLCGLPVPERLGRLATTHRYNQTIFITPFWPEIFTRDSERRQDPDEARRTYETMARVYPALGYDLVELPKASVEARIALILAKTP